MRNEEGFELTEVMGMFATGTLAMASYRAYSPSFFPYFLAMDWRSLARRVCGRWRRYVRLRLRRRVLTLTRATAFKQLNLQCVEARITSFLVRCPTKLSWPRF